jgi:glyoxylase-like metal-dependent hydrolase (beta-lactamase superfamily II)
MRDWKLEAMAVGPLQMNAVLLTSPDPAGGAGEAILIDPGEEAPRLLAAVAGTGCRLTALLATHGHFDHVGAAAAVQEEWDLPLRCHAAAVPFIERMPEIQAGWGFPPSAVPRCAPDLDDGGTIPFAGSAIEIRHVPGHSPGQVMFLLPGYAVVGDCLFQGSVGRTDLPGGDFEVLQKSIRERIYTLPEATIVVSGHGPETTVGRERATNPFVRG